MFAGFNALRPQVMRAHKMETEQRECRTYFPITEQTYTAWVISLNRSKLECTIQFPADPEGTQEDDKNHNGGPMRPEGNAVFEGARLG